MLQFDVCFLIYQSCCRYWHPISSNISHYVSETSHTRVSSSVAVNQAAKEDTMVVKVGSVAMAPQADNPLGRSVLRKDIYQ